jgi:hypothetical protein
MNEVVAFQNNCLEVTDWVAIAALNEGCIAGGLTGDDGLFDPWAVRLRVVSPVMDDIVTFEDQRLRNCLDCRRCFG